MANEQNLIPTNRRSKKEARELGKKGGIKSGEVRREKASMREAVKLFLSLPIADTHAKDQLKALGVDENRLTNAMLPMLGLYKKACKGDSAAARLLAELNGETDVQGVTKIGDGLKIEVTYSDEAGNDED